MKQSLIFISHSSSDARFAEVVVSQLEAQGFTCWMAPRDVPPGSVYADEILSALERSKAFVLLLSADCLASKHVMRELDLAIHELPIFPIRIEDIEPEGGMKYMLGPAQWVDAFSEPREAAVELAAQSLIGPLGGVTKRLPPTRRRVTSPVATRAKWLAIAGIVAMLVCGGLLAFRGKSSDKQISDEAVIASSMFALDLRLPGGKREFREGDLLTFEVESDVDCYLALVSKIGGDNPYDLLLFPNTNQKDAFIKGGVNVTLPSVEETKMYVGAPFGKDSVWAMAWTTEEGLKRFLDKHYKNLGTAGNPFTVMDSGSRAVYLRLAEETAIRSAYDRVDFETKAR